MSDRLTDRIAQILNDNGLADGHNGFHGWRCAEPDRYGPCTCVAEVAAEIRDLAVAGEYRRQQRVIDRVRDLANEYATLADDTPHQRSWWATVASDLRLALARADANEPGEPT